MEIIQTPEIAERIGALYRRARDSHRESVTYLIECGEALIAQKAALPHGEWLLWIKAHEHLLGFGERAAHMMMRGAKIAGNPQSTADLTDDQCAKLSRAIWGNEPDTSPIQHDPFDNFHRFHEWASKHSNDFVELSIGQRALLMDLYLLIGRALTLPAAREAA